MGVSLVTNHARGAPFRGEGLAYLPNGHVPSKAVKQVRANRIRWLELEQRARVFTFLGRCPGCGLNETGTWSLSVAGRACCPRSPGIPDCIVQDPRRPGAVCSKESTMSTKIDAPGRTDEPTKNYRRGLDRHHEPWEGLVCGGEPTTHASAPSGAGGGREGPERVV
jgi:hypothetical protein